MIYTPLNGGRGIKGTRRFPPPRPRRAKPFNFGETFFYQVVRHDDICGGYTPIPAGSYVEADYSTAHFGKDHRYWTERENADVCAHDVAIIMKEGSLDKTGTTGGYYYNYYIRPFLTILCTAP